MSLEHVTVSELVAALPPPEAAPIVTKISTYGLSRFRDIHAIPTPLLHEGGPVDYETLLRNLGEYFDPAYRWKAPFFDEHHLQWRADLYRPQRWDEDHVPSQFRDQSTNKLWLPRQFHHFIHVMTQEPDVPDMEVMRREVKQYRRHAYMYRLVSGMIALAEAQERAEYHPAHKLYVDVQGRRSFGRDTLEENRKRFIRVLENNIAKGLLPDLSELHVLALVQEELPLLEVLPRIRKQIGEVAVMSTNKRRSGRSVSLPVHQAA